MDSLSSLETFEIGLLPNSMIRDDSQGLVLSSSWKHLIYCMKYALLRHYGPCQGQAHSCQLYMILYRLHHIPDHPLALCPTYTLSLSPLLTFLHIPPSSYYPCSCTKLFTPVRPFLVTSLNFLFSHLPT